MNIKTILVALATMLMSSTAIAEPLPTRITTEPDRAEMILIPAGKFIYGINQKELKALIRKLKTGWAKNIFPTEIRKRTRTLPDFYIDRYEVTNEQYNNFVSATEHRQSRFTRYPQLNAPKQPVVGVGWSDAIAYCEWSQKRLPTEEEWEKAARGTDGRIWPWGNKTEAKIFNGKAIANYAPLEVGKFPKSDSPYGVSDMAGNVWEMTSGNWKKDAKAMRGGSFLNNVAEVRTTVRWAASDEEDGANWLGFRCVKDAK